METSIAVPVYNAEPYPGECLKLGLDQDYSDTEAISVDDGSAETPQGHADRRDYTYCHPGRSMQPDRHHLRIVLRMGASRKRVASCLPRRPVGPWGEPAC